MAPISARIVILNYNGELLLPQCLPSIVEAAQKSSFPTKITLLDNQSTDAGVEYVKQHFPQVDILLAPENKLLCSYNDCLKTLNEPIVILLNNDIRVDAHFVDPLIRKLSENPVTFLVAPKVMSFDGQTLEGGKTVAKIKWGMFWTSGRTPLCLQESDKASETFAAGFGAFSREKFCELEGFDPLYLPGIFEDIDLCYRAKQKGYGLYYEPSSVVYHMGQASFKKAFGTYAIACLAHRNNFLFMWKNFKQPFFWIQHLLLLPLRLLFALLKGQFCFFQGWIQALTKISALHQSEPIKSVRS